MDCMGSQSSTPLPAPSNWQDFEHLCWDLWRAEWRDPNALRHGRSGQAQQGVDVYGRHDGAWVGVQCKRVEDLTEKFLCDEVKKAKGFAPGLGHFIMATSDPKKDAALEKLARQLTDAADPPFAVSVMYWPDIWERLCAYPEKIRRHYPDYYGQHFGPTAPPLAVREVEDSEQARFYFGARHIPLLGRDDELAQLLDFATQGSSKPRWWLLGGEGGAGKSRLALELALRCEDLGWHAGFVDWDAAFDWDKWEPDRPCLLVVDYAQKDAAKYGTWLRRLCDRRSGFAHPLRVLLLERDLKGPWLDQLMGSGSDEARLEAHRYLPLQSLPALSPAVLWEIVETVFTNKETPLPPRDKALADLTRIDPHGRPLFAALFADSLAEGGDTAHWDDQTLIRAILKRESDKFWKPVGVTDDDLNLLALATMTGGLDLTAEITAELRQAGLIDAAIPRNRSRYSALCNRKVTTHLFPLEPDILGESFVLDRIAKDCTADPSLAELLWRYGWRLNPLAMTQFLDRTGRDFPYMSILLQLTLPPEGGRYIKVLWAMLVSNLVWYFHAEHYLNDALFLLNRLWELSQQYVEETEIRCAWARGAFNLIHHFLRVGRVSDATALHKQLWSLVETYDSEPEIRLIWAKGTFNLIDDMLSREKGEPHDLLDSLWEVSQAYVDEFDLIHVWANAVFNCSSHYASNNRLDNSVYLLERLRLAIELYAFDPHLVHEWAKGIVNVMPDLAKSGLLPQAETWLERLYELSNSDGASAEIRLRWAQGVWNLINELSSTSRLARTESFLQQLWPIVTSYDGEIQVRQIWAQAAVTMIQELPSVGRLPEAEILFDRMGGLLRTNKDNSDIGCAWALSAVSLIDELSIAGRLPDAEALLDRLWNLVTENTERPEWRGTWAFGAINLCLAYLRAEKPDQAVALLGRLQAEPNPGEHLSECLQILAAALGRD